MVPLPSIVDALLHLLNLLVLFHKEVLCFDSSLNRIEVRTGQGSSLVVKVGVLDIGKRGGVEFA